MSSCLVKYIVSVTLTRTPTLCSHLQTILSIVLGFLCWLFWLGGGIPWNCLLTHLWLPVRTQAGYFILPSSSLLPLQRYLGAFFLSAFPHDDSVLLALIIVQNVPLTCKYGICVVGKWDLGWLLVEFIVFWVSLALALFLAPPSELEWILQESCNFGFYVVQFCLSPPPEIPLSST